MTRFFILAILSFIAGLGFIAAGVYFLSSSYLTKLNNGTFDKSPQNLKKNKIRANFSACTGIGLGAFTEIFGILLLLFPEFSMVLVLIYMILSMISCIVLMTVYK